jgi:hypothetical protein
LRKPWLLLAVGVILCQNPVLCGPTPDKAAYSNVLDVLNALWQYERSGRPHGSRRIAFELPVQAINSYLSIALKLKPRPGIESLNLAFFPHNRIVAEARIDFTQVRLRPSKALSQEVLGQLKGSQVIKAEFRFRIKRGKLTFKVLPVPSDGVKLPKRALEDVIRAVAAMQPEKIDTSRPIPVPFGLTLATGDRMLTGHT